MNIELRAIRVNTRMSEETTCFTASLYIDGKKIGHACNRGTGGPTEYGADSHELYDKLREAEEYCKSLPPYKYESQDGSATIPMDMELFIDIIVDNFLQEREHKKREKRMQTHIIWATHDKYAETHWPGKTLQEIMDMPGGKEMVAVTIEKLKKKHPEGRLLNTNIKLD
jgi:hypothetical protein